jgi:hypothetical protein
MYERSQRKSKAQLCDSSVHRLNRGSPYYGKPEEQQTREIFSLIVDAGLLVAEEVAVYTVLQPVHEHESKVSATKLAEGPGRVADNVASTCFPGVEAPLFFSSLFVTYSSHLKSLPTRQAF